MAPSWDAGIRWPATVLRFSAEIGAGKGETGLAKAIAASKKLEEVMAVDKTLLKCQENLMAARCGLGQVLREPG